MRVALHYADVSVARMPGTPVRRLSAPRLCLLSIFAASVVWWPMFLRPFASGYGDWQFFHHMWEAARISVLRHGEFPLWDPYHCGGVTLWGNPQNQSLSPFFVLSFLTGTVLAQKVYVLLHAAAGFFGTFRLAERETEVSAIPAALVAFAWSASGFFIWHASGGHSAFVPFFLIPFVLLSFHRCLEDPRYVLAVAGLLVWMFLHGSVYPVPYAIVLLCFTALLEMIRRRSFRVIILRGAAIAAFTGLLSAIRVVPVIDELRRSPRAVALVDRVSPGEILDFLIVRSHPRPFPPHEYVWSEYGAFVGIGVVVLAMAGGVIAFLGGPEARHARRMSLGFIVFSGLMLGNWGPWSPWVLLHQLPIYDSLRVPSRFRVFAVLYLALLAGIALQRIIDLAERKLSSEGDPVQQLRAKRAIGLAGVIIVAFLAADIVHAAFPLVKRFHYAEVGRDSPAKRFHYTESPHDEYAQFPARNVGTSGCMEAMSFSVTNGLWRGDVPQVRIAGTTGEITSWARTNNTISASVWTDGPGELWFNQNAVPGWTANVGEQVTEATQLRLRVASGRHDVVWRYRPRSISLAIALTFVGVIASAVFLYLAKRKSAS